MADPQRCVLRQYTIQVNKLVNFDRFLKGSKDKEALFNVAYNVTDNISSCASGGSRTTYAGGA